MQFEEIEEELDKYLKKLTPTPEVVQAVQLLGEAWLTLRLAIYSQDGEVGQERIIH